MLDLMKLVTEQTAAVVFIATLAARIGAPVPAAPVLVVAGGLLAGGQVSLVAILLAALLANVLGDGLWFYAGRRYGYRILRLLCRISLSPDACVRESESLITRWGGASLIAAKYVPGVSVVAPPMAGALGMSLVRFLSFELLAAAIWACSFLALGWVFSEQIQLILQRLAQAGGIATLVLLAIAALLGWRYWRRRKSLQNLAMPRISVDELDTLIAQNRATVVIDVRSEAALMLSPQRIPGARTHTLRELQNGLAVDLPPEAEVVIYCNCPNELSAVQAAQALMAHGHFKVRPLAGGLDAWVAAGKPTVGEPMAGMLKAA